MKKRLLASLLCLCLIVGLLPTAALAVDETTDGETLVVCAGLDGCVEDAHDEGCPLYVTPNEPDGDETSDYEPDDVTESAESSVDMPFTVYTDNSEDGIGYEIASETVEEYNHPWADTKKDITVYILKITSAGCYTIKQTDTDLKNPVTNWRIEVSADSGTVELVLSGLNIDLHKTGVHTGKNLSDGCAAFSITGDCDTVITLADNSTNTLISGSRHAGLENQTHPVTIQCETAKSNVYHDCEENGSCGSLTAKTEWHAAGIGGGKGDGANITFKGGKVNATGNGGSGIGGGNATTAEDNVSGHDITILGGYIVATSPGSSAGIGGGYNYWNGADGYNIFISGGTVIATSDAKNYAAGIGGGFKGDGTNITITGGHVTAVGGTGAGIGGGDGAGNGENITITGGTVSATSSSRGAGIGGGQKGTGSNITITGGTVSAASNANGAGIGGGGSWDAEVGSAENIHISDSADVTVKSQSGVDIGGGSTSGTYAGGNANNILITTPIKTEDNSILTVGSGSGSNNVKGEETLIIYVGEDGEYHFTTSNGQKISVTPIEEGERIAIGRDNQLIIPEGGVTVKTNENETDKALSAGSIIHSDGAITIPAGGSYGEETYPNGATVDEDGTVKRNAVLTLSSTNSTVYSNAGAVKFTYTYDGDGAVTASSSDDTVATAAVDTGAKTVTVTILKVGTATITVNAAAGTNCNAVSAAYSLTVYQYSGGSSGGSSSSGYAVSVDSAKNGTVTVSPRNASKGTTVTITVKPDKGYEVDEIIVTDKNGNELKVTRKSDTRYTFTMPSGKVTVEASFAKIEVAPDEGLAFVDVPANAYYADAVAWAVENGITSGTSATTFSPNAACTRAQMMTFLWRAAGSPKAAGNNPFTDLDASAYYYDAVLWAVSEGITSGTSATTFGPNDTVTRGQTVTFQHRAAGSPAVSGGSFGDVAADAYYANAVAWAVSEGVTSGTGGNSFSPDADCTRGQIVTFMYRDAT